MLSGEIKMTDLTEAESRVMRRLRREKITEESKRQRRIEEQIQLLQQQRNEVILSQRQRRETVVPEESQTEEMDFSPGGSSQNTRLIC